jgi:hypothetical protein
MRDETGEGTDRRRLPGFGVTGTVALFLASWGLFASSAAASGPCAQATSVAVLAGPDEPGERLVVTGTVFGADGVTPAPGVFLYAYHTDATGHYSRESGAPPRLHGWMKSGPDGKYEYRTIRPAPYPGRSIAAHVHTQLWGGGHPPQWGTDLLLEGDSLITAAQRSDSEKLGRFAFVRPTQKGEHGVWHAVHDLRLKTKGDHFQSNILHGLKPCGVQP